MLRNSATSLRRSFASAEMTITDDRQEERLAAGAVATQTTTSTATAGQRPAAATPARATAWRGACTGLTSGAASRSLNVDHPRDEDVEEADGVDGERALGLGHQLRHEDD